MKPSRNVFLTGLLTTSAVLTAVPTAVAANFTWNGNNANWNTPSEWTVPGPPSGGANNFAIINSGVANITQDQAAIQDILINNTGVVGGTGTVAHSAGAISTTGWVRMGLGSGGTATYNLDGGSLTNTRLVVSETSKAVFGMTSGTLLANGEIWVGGANDGTMNFTGGTATATSWLAVGRNGIGQLNISNGTFNAATTGGNITLGSFGGATGTVNMNSGVLTTANAIFVGEGGAGILNVAGGLVSATGGTAGLVVATGATGSGTVNLDGGTISVRTVTKGSGTGTFNFNGGTLQARAAGTLMTGLTNAFVKAGGASIDSNGNNVTIAQNLITDAVSTGGGLVKSGAGPLTLTGANTYTGTTSINAGLLNFRNLTSMPGYATATGSGNTVSIATGSSLAVGVGGASGFSIADFDAIKANTSGKFNFATASGIGMDTTNGNVSYTGLVNDFTGGPTIFSKLGTNSLILNSAHTYTGVTNVIAGTLQLGDGTTDASLATSAVTNTGTLEFRTVLNQSPAYAITGTGAITKSGAAALTLAGTNTAGNFFVKDGSVTLGAGTSLTLTSYQSVGQVAGDKGILNVGNGATYTSNQDFNVGDVGGGSGTVPVNGNNGGVVNVSGTGTTMTLGSMFVGKGGNVATNGNKATGVFNQTGGAVSTAANTQIGGFGIGQYNLSGGTFTRTNGFLSIARQTGSVGVVDISGGTLNDNTPGNRSIVGELGTAVLNVRTGGNFVIGSSSNNSGGTLTSGLAALTIGNNAGSLGVVNLMDGGTITTRSIGSVGATATSILNFNGGVLKNAAETATFIQNLTTANVFAGGAKIDTTAGNATISQKLEAPAGNGVASISATGSGFTTTPIVQITGGGGTGATAVATVDGAGALTGFIITSPGTGYTSAPTVTISDAFGTQLAGTSALNAGNTSGGLTKQGINTLTLTAASTYTGATVVSAGTLLVNGSLTGTSGVTVSSGATLGGNASTIAGNSVVDSGGFISPGNSVGTISLANLDLQGTYLAEITGNGVNDQINAAAGNFNVGNNALISILLSYNPAAGDSFDLVNFANYTGDSTPAFSFNQGLDSGLSWDTSNFTSNGIITVIPEPSVTLLAVAGSALLLRRRRKEA